MNPGSPMVATLIFAAPSGSDLLRVVRASSGIQVGGPLLLAPDSQRIKIKVNAYCDSTVALMSLLDFFGQLQPRIVIRMEVVRIGDREANALVFVSVVPSYSDGVLVNDGDSCRA